MSSSAKKMDASTLPSHAMKPREQKVSHLSSHQHFSSKPNQVSTVLLYGIPIVSLVIDAQERLCLAQISNTLLKQFSYNEIHNRRVALGITCVQCTPVQLEILRRAGAMPVSSRRCGMITRREAERLCKSFLGDNAPPRLPDDFAFSVHHECAWGCRGAFLPSRYNSSRAKCIKCSYCALFFSPNKFIFHSHRTGAGDKYVQPDAANFNSWRRHMKLSGTPPDEITHAWEDVKAMFNGGTRKRLMASSSISSERSTSSVTPPKQPKINTESPTPLSTGITFPVTSPSPALTAPTPRVPPFPDIALPLSKSLVMDYMWHQSQAVKQHPQFPFSPYTLPWLKRGSPLFFGHTAAESSLISWRNANTLYESKPMFHQSAFRPVQAGATVTSAGLHGTEDLSDDETVDIETTEDEELTQRANTVSPRPTWSSPSRADAEHTSETVRSRTPILTPTVGPVHSSSPVILKVESNSSPPLALGLPMPSAIRHSEHFERDEPIPLDISMEASHIYGNARVFAERQAGVDFRERQSLAESIDFHRGNLKEVMNLSATERVPDFPHRDTLWSVARLSLERQDHVSDPYKADRTYAHTSNTRDKEPERGHSQSPLCNSRKSDCSSCPACHPNDQPSHSHSPRHSSLMINENNNKISNT